MRILHYIYGVEPFRTGGLITYAFDLAKTESEHGLETLVLVPGNINRKSVRISRTKACRGLDVYKISKALPIPLTKGISDKSLFLVDEGYDVYKEFLEKKKIDVIHVHSLMGIHRAFFKAAKDLGIRIVFTTHDYFGLCPCTNLYRISENCGNKDWSGCAECNREAFGKLHLTLDQSWEFQFLMYLTVVRMAVRIMAVIKSRLSQNTSTTACDNTNAVKNVNLEDLRKYYREMFDMVDIYHFNSVVSQNVFTDRLGSLNGEIIPILTKNIRDNRRKRICSDVLRIGYLGPKSIVKGFFELYKALENIHDNGGEFIFNTYYGAENEAYEWHKCNEPYKYEDLGRIMDQNDVIVVPSLWRETFGLVVAEALSYGVPVIISDKVGAQSILDEFNADVGMIVSSDDIRKELTDSIGQLMSDHSIINGWNDNILNGELAFSFDTHTDIVVDKCYLGNAVTGEEVI